MPSLLMALAPLLLGFLRSYPICNLTYSSLSSVSAIRFCLAALLLLDVKSRSHLLSKIGMLSTSLSLSDFSKTKSPSTPSTHLLDFNKETFRHTAEIHLRFMQ